MPPTVADSLPHRTSDILLHYFSKENLGVTENWSLNSSSLGGRGLFATRDLKPGSLLFKEKPLVMGPRNDPRCPLVCVGCHRLCSSDFCPKCALPLCSDTCVNSMLHTECNIIQELSDETLNGKMALVAPLRAVSLGTNERDVLTSLECHNKPEHISLMEKVHKILSKEDLQIFRACLQVLDATAFEVPCPGAGSGSVRAIYPTAALMNHNCSPNTRHSFDQEGRIVVETTREVLENEELCTTYTCLTWGTQARSLHLKATKHFVCNCRRCRDTEEFGANLMALYCQKKECDGSILPLSNNAGSAWICSVCGKKSSSLQVTIIQKSIAGALSRLGKDPRDISRLLRKKCIIPGSNQAAVEFKLNLARTYGSTSLPWTELSDDDLILKEVICKELIALFTLLGLGACRLKGFMDIELIATLNEKKRRHLDISSNNLNIADLFDEAACIFKYDEKSLKALNAAFEGT